jgi:hypothetical protein
MNRRIGARLLLTTGAIVWAACGIFSAVEGSRGECDQLDLVGRHGWLRQPAERSNVVRKDFESHCLHFRPQPRCHNTHLTFQASRSRLGN